MMAEAVGFIILTIGIVIWLFVVFNEMSKAEERLQDTQKKIQDIRARDNPHALRKTTVVEHKEQEADLATPLIVTAIAYQATQLQEDTYQSSSCNYESNNSSYSDSYSSSSCDSSSSGGWD